MIDNTLGAKAGRKEHLREEGDAANDAEYMVMVAKTCRMPRSNSISSLVSRWPNSRFLDIRFGPFENPISQFLDTKVVDNDMSRGKSSHLAEYDKSSERNVRFILQTAARIC